MHRSGRPSQLTRSRLPLTALLALLVVAVMTSACSGNSARPSPPATPSSTASAAASLPAAGRFIVSEYHGEETRLFSVSPANLSDRRPLLRIPHAPNWAPRVAVAPGGGKIAYVAVPPGATSPDREGTLWVVDLVQREPRRLAVRLDARGLPTWSPSGSRIAYMRISASMAGGPQTVIEEVDVATARLSEVATSTRLFPVGYDRAGARLWFVRYERDGAFLEWVDPATRAGGRTSRLGDGVARDFHVAPDGSSVIYLALGGTPARYHAMVAPLGDGDARPLLPSIPRTEDVGVAWRAVPGGQALPVVGMTTGGRPAGAVLVAVPGGDAESVVRSTTGFDVPVAWAADGQLLLARTFTGATADEPGRESLTLIDGEGGRRAVTGDGPLEFVGWVTDAP